jgi:hypothetical protein
MPVSVDPGPEGVGEQLSAQAHAQHRLACPHRPLDQLLLFLEAFLGITTIGFPASISGLTWMDDLLHKPSWKR